MAGAAVLVALSVAAAGATWFVQRERTRRAVATIDRLTTEAAQARRADPRRAALYAVVAAKLRVRLDPGDRARVPAVRAQLAASLADPRLLGNAHALPLVGVSGPVHAVAMSRYARLAMAGPDGAVSIGIAGLTPTPTGPTVRHGDAVYGLAFSPDGTRLATAGGDGTAQLWDVRTGARIGPALRHDDAVYGVAFSRDGARLATGSLDGTAQLWDVRTGAEAGPAVRPGGDVFGVALSPDGRHLLTGGADGLVRYWDARTGAAAGPPLRHGAAAPGGRSRAAVLGVAFTRDGAYLATGGADGTARVWDARTRARIGPALRHDGAVTAIAFSRDGGSLLAASDGAPPRVWETPYAAATALDRLCAHLYTSTLPGDLVGRLGLDPEFTRPCKVRG